MKEMGLRIRLKREECNLTMEELGKKLGVSRQTICKWEKGSVKSIERIHVDDMAKIFGCKPGWLAGYEDGDDVTVTYAAPGKESVSMKVGKTPPIIGVTAKRAELYDAVLNVPPECYDVAIRLLKSLSKKEEDQ